MSMKVAERDGFVIDSPLRGYFAGARKAVGADVDKTILDKIERYVPTLFQSHFATRLGVETVKLSNINIEELKESFKAKTMNVNVALEEIAVVMFNGANAEVVKDLFNSLGEAYKAKIKRKAPSDFEVIGDHSESLLKIRDAYISHIAANKKMTATAERLETLQTIFTVRAPFMMATACKHLDVLYPEELLSYRGHQSLSAPSEAPNLKALKLDQCLPAIMNYFYAVVAKSMTEKRELTECELQELKTLFEVLKAKSEAISQVGSLATTISSLDKKLVVESNEALDQIAYFDSLIKGTKKARDEKSAERNVYTNKWKPLVEEASEYKGVYTQKVKKFNKEISQLDDQIRNLEGKKASTIARRLKAGVKEALWSKLQGKVAFGQYFYAVLTGLNFSSSHTQASVRCAHCDLGYGIPVLWTSEPRYMPLKNTVLKHESEVRRTGMS
jgi:hypothetical protein